MNGVLAALCTAALLALSVAAVQTPAAQAPAFEVFHMSSDVEGNAFREVFIVTASTGTVRTDAIALRLDGDEFGHEWNDKDGLIGINDTFSFVQEAFDEKQVLTGHWQGQEVMRCLFGGGAGIGLHPQEWRDANNADQVRCLQLTDDQ